MSYYIVSRLLGGMMVLLLCHVGSCRREADEAETQVRGHDLRQAAVPHGYGLMHAERYCSHCHGANLSGGAKLEPSCYACHGKNWRDDPEAPSVAPSHHSVDLGGWLHDPAYTTPAAVCSECHGADLQGDLVRGTPGCLLCHTALWQP